MHLTTPMRTLCLPVAKFLYFMQPIFYQVFKSFFARFKFDDLSLVEMTHKCLTMSIFHIICTVIDKCR